jgi:hypothetical protein
MAQTGINLRDRGVKMPAHTRTTRWSLICLVVLTVLPYLARPAPVLGKTEVKPASLSGGGGESQSASFLVNDTVAQGPVGPLATGGGMELLDGFWRAAILPAEGDTMPPATVSSLQAVAGDEQVHLSWVNPGDQDFAKTVIRYSTSGYPGTPVQGTAVENGFGGVFEGEPGATDSFTHEGLTNGTTYFYTAFAFDSSSNYSSGVITSATPFDVDPPLAVAQFSTQGGDTTVTLRWTNPADTDFDHTLIRYSTSGYPTGPASGLAVENGNNGMFGNTPASVDSFVHTGLTNGLTYWYTAFAGDEVPNYASGVTAFATPSDEDPPSEVIAFSAEGADTTVVLRWTNPADADFDHTLIRYSTVEYPSGPTDGSPVENGAGGKFKNAPASADSFYHTGLTNGTVYYYAAFAGDEVPNYSEIVGDMATPVDTLPPAPVASFAAVARNDGTVKLRWTSSADPDVHGVHIRYSDQGYPADETDRLYVDNGAGGMFVAAPAEADSFIQTGLTSGTMYFYAAFAYDEADNFSSGVTATATPHDEVAPVLDVSVFQNPYLTNHLDIFTIPTEAILDTSLVVVCAGSTLEMEVVDPAERVYRGDYDLYTAGLVSIRASGRDVNHNWGWTERTFTSTYIFAGAGGVARSADGLCSLKIPGSSAGNDMYVLVFQNLNEGEVVYKLSPAVAFDDYVEISIAFGEEIHSPEHLAIARVGEAAAVPLESYIVKGENRVVAHVNKLGSFRLLWRPDIETPAYGDGDLMVLQNVPNPFLGSTTIGFEMPRLGTVKIDIVSVDGRIIRNLLDGTVLPGRRSVEWDGRDASGNRVASGVYLYRVCTDSRIITRKMILLR